MIDRHSVSPLPDASSKTNNMTCSKICRHCHATLPYASSMTSSSEHDLQRYVTVYASRLWNSSTAHLSLQVHAFIISELRKQMPSMIGKEKKKKELIQNLDKIFEQIQVTHQRTEFRVWHSSSAISARTQHIAWRFPRREQDARPATNAGLHTIQSIEAEAA